MIVHLEKVYGMSLCGCWRDGPATTTRCPDQATCETCIELNLARATAEALGETKGSYMCAEACPGGVTPGIGALCDRCV